MALERGVHSGAHDRQPNASDHAGTPPDRPLHADPAPLEQALVPFHSTKRGGTAVTLVWPD